MTMDEQALNKNCPFKTIRDWPGCYEDCEYAGTDDCPNHKVS